ncbi:MAG: PilZ domain-containing protein [Desulfosarcina sp.]|nr:PilZ domain-containing protein [Desulfosarcina sp.]MBC2744074.1 PilZ domain-containing protein [Desulfosarcina sp.]MBC2766983.1 PilZ domain-containing protein [Desulfosarcina sp.]
MRIAAIAANIAQLVIILAIFFIRGLDLGAQVIFLLFLLMSVPFINFLALFFWNRPMLESASNEIEENGLIKREAMRIRYREGHCPVLKTGNTAFAVLDLSEGGVRISASSATPLKKKVHGEIQLISGDLIRFKATVTRREEGEVVLQFADPIGTAFLMGEKKAMAADNAG